MILIFNTYSGLCNQFYDVNAGINFCLQNKIKFTFHCASFRNVDLTSWRDVKFTDLFDDLFLRSNDDISELYVDYDSLSPLLNNDNTFNLDNKLRTIEFLNKNDDLLKQLNTLNKEYIVLKQFWAVYDSSKNIKNIYPLLKPNKKLSDLYLKVKESLSCKEYNFLHYRYESDFINHFKITDMMSLDELITNNKFKNNKAKIYVAASNIKYLLKKISEKNIGKIIYKNEEELDLKFKLNFEEKAFIDYMLGLDSVEIYGHSKSSFSHMINNLKRTNNYYQ